MKTMLKIRSFFLIGLLAVAVLGISVLPISAQDTTVLTANSGDGNSVWYISGEPSLVMNGFDLTPLGLARPIVIEQVSLSVATPVASSPVDILIYQDANGGSPVDSVLVGQAQATITTAGTFTFTFDTPVAVTEPVVWIGFYLPVDFEFYADTSGTSVLTYWAWANGGTFDPANLSAAAVFGPADGTAPVNLDMKGIARITARVRSANEAEAAQGATIVQVTGKSDVQLTPPMTAYEYCSPVLVDQEDLAITMHEDVDLYCNVAWAGFAPESPAGYERRGFLYDIFAFGTNMPRADKLAAPVTHCIRPAAEDLETAVIGLASGSPRLWRILPSQRYNDVVCAEFSDMGFLSYFVPTTPQ
jgi:hypothetical protein